MKTDFSISETGLLTTQENPVTTAQPTKYSLWFDAFVRNTNQKSLTIELLGGFLQQLHTNKKDELAFMDVGCSRGQQGYQVIRNLPKNKVRYLGVDAEESDLAEAEKLFQASEIPSTLILGDCFNDKIQASLPKADIILLSHVAYYTKNLPDFVKMYASKLTDSGIAIFVHNVPESDTKQLRNKFGTNVTEDTTGIIEDILPNLGPMSGISYHSYVRFPENMDQYWKMLSEASYDKEFTSQDRELLDAKYLLEFIVQQSLETLQERGLLDAYLTDARERLAAQNNCLLPKSRIQMTASPNCQPEFLSQFEQAFTAMAQEIAKQEQTPVKEKLREFID